MTLEEVLDVLIRSERAGKNVVRLHTGDPCLYGAIREQMDALKKEHISYEICPGVSSFCGAAAALEAEYTLPGVSQSVVITRTALIVVGNVLGDQYDRSELYNPAFTTEFRKASLPPDDRSSGNPGTSDRGNVMYTGAADHTNGTHFREEDTV